MVWVWLVFVFVLGAGVGSFLNLLVSRLPLERSAIWPLTSRCLNCYQPIRWYDNLPLISYISLRGRCRKCSASFSPRYFFVELMTAAGFVLIFYIDIILNQFNVPFIRERSRWIIQFGAVPWQAWVFFLFHATLFGFLVVAAFCDIARREIPLSVTMTGVIVGLIAAMILPWPWPNVPLPKLTLGAQPWPLWFPLPFGLKPGTWQLGLVNSLAGALVGLIMLRLVRFVFSSGLGVEALGLGDADLMMMAGSFLGWQIVVMSFFVGAVAALLLALPLLIIKGNVPFAFGPGLALGVIATVVAWPILGPRLEFFLLDGWLIGPMAGIMIVGMFIGARVLRRPPMLPEQPVAPNP